MQVGTCRALLAGLLLAALPVTARAATAKVLKAAPAADAHIGWLEPQFKALLAELKQTSANPTIGDDSLDPAVTLDKIQTLKEQFIDKRTAEYEQERMQQVVIASVKAGRVALFGGRGWRKSFTTASTSGVLWQVESHRYRETSGKGDRRHNVTALPNGYALQVAAKEVFQTQKRSHSKITGELTVTYARNPLWIQLQCELEWSALLKKIGGK